LLTISQQALEEIHQELGDSSEEIISTDPDDLHAHGYSEWSSSNPDGLPVAVAYPRSTEQVSTIARICHKYRIPIIPYSGGSSLEGNFSAPYGGISVDFAYMDQIVRFNKDDMDIVVQPSIGWQDLNEQLAKMESGLFFPIDPGMCEFVVSLAVFAVLVDQFAAGVIDHMFQIKPDANEYTNRSKRKDWWHDWNELLWN
jgi:hypothetical protein